MPFNLLCHDGTVESYLRKVGRPSVPDLRRREASSEHGETNAPMRSRRNRQAW